MKLNIPFYNQTTPLNCGPTALKCVFSYFGKEIDLSFIEEKAGIKPEKGVGTIQLAIASASLGFKTELYSKEMGFNKKNLNLDFYKKYNSLNQEFTEELILKAKSLNIKLQEKTLALQNLLNFLTTNSVPIVLIDWNQIVNKKGYQGHFVPIVGYDENNVYIHNVASQLEGKFIKISRKIFDKARKSKGTDEDVLVILKN